MSDPTPKMNRLLGAVTDEWLLAYDVAQSAEVDNRTAGIRLSALADRGLVERQYDEKARVWRYRLAPQ